MGYVAAKVECDVCGKEIKPTGRHTPDITAWTTVWITWQRGGVEYRIQTKGRYCHRRCEAKLFEKLIEELRKKVGDFPSKFPNKAKDDPEFGDPADRGRFPSKRP